MTKLASWARSAPGLLICCVLVLSGSGIVVPSEANARNKSLKLYYTHTKERATITFKRNGKYDQAGLKKLNTFLRDWRRNEPTKMDPKLFDLMWEVYKQSGAKNHIHVVSAYRSPATNEMLRKTRGGQATKSQHMYGRAIDFFIPGVKTSTLRKIGMKLQGGGVGYYPRSATPFVHLDVASVRAWPRMSRSELVSLFPDGKTMHIPPDGKPLPGYKTALAEYKRRNGTIKSTPAKKSEPARTLVAKAEPKSDSGTKRSGNLLTNLFGRNRNNNDQPSAAPTAPAQQRTVVASLPQTAQNFAALPKTNIPVPVLSFAPEQTEVPNSATISEPTPTTAPTPAATLVADNILTQEPGQVSTTVLASLSAADTGSNASAISSTDVPVLAYQDQQRTLQPESFAAIMNAAIETDRQRKLNGEAQNPIVAGIVKQEPKRFDIASIETPVLRAHNRLSRADFGQEVTNAVRRANRKSARPNLRDALSKGLKSSPKEPDLQQIHVSRRALSKDSIVSMKAPKTAPGFVSDIMRKPPIVVHVNGFSKAHQKRQNHKSFAGNAVSFLPVVRYDG